MYVSHDSSEETERRLRQVIAEATLECFPGEYAFVERPLPDFPAELATLALAFVRDHQVWSALVPSSDTAAERFFIFSFHFTPGLDNSGFVGWLASTLKRALGTGVFVVCGQNTDQGGIFDYWGAPLAMKDEVVRTLSELRGNA
ncbi:MAG TPA: DUF6196 family protein [Holophagaceae bacterium]|nr:DUF6196 family protein [Holophagaceae bacterium]